MILGAVLYSAVAGIFFTNSAIERGENPRLEPMKGRDLARISVLSLLWPGVCAAVAFTALHGEPRELAPPAPQPYGNPA